MQVKDFDRHHPDYDHACLERWEALYEGGEEWRELIETWVPPYGALTSGGHIEGAAMLAERRARAEYVNDVAPMVDLVVAQLFGEPARITGLDDDTTKRLTVNADGLGTTWDLFWRHTVRHALIARRGWVWIDAPASTGDAPVSLADEIRTRKPYLRQIEPEVVIDWGSGADGRLAWALLREEVCEGGDPTEDGDLTARSEAIRWTLVTDRLVRRWIWKPQPGQTEPRPEDVVADLDTRRHGFTDATGRPMFPMVRLELPTGLHALGKLEGPAVALMRARLDLDWLLYKTAHPLLTVTVREGDEFQPRLGAGAYMLLHREKEGGADDAAWIAPDSGPAEVLRKRVDQGLADLYRVLHQMALTASASPASQRQSGESKVQDWTPAQMLLGSLQAVTIGAMDDAATIVGGLQNVAADAVRVDGLDGWQHADDAAWFDLAALAVEAKQASPTFVRLVAKSQAERILGDEVAPEAVQAVIDEIDAWEPGPSLAYPSGAPTKADPTA